jgi:Rieske Fe-S protein
MGTIPVAHPSPPRRLAFPRRGIAVAVVLSTVAIGLMVVAVFAWPTGSKVDQLSWFTAGDTSDFAINEPVRFTDHRFWLVQLNEDDFVALLTRDPHLGCTVPWRPDFEFGGKTGWFRNPCHNETYDLTGRCFYGPCVRGMDRFAVKIDRGKVLVDTRAITLGPTLGTEYSPCPLDDPYWIVNCTPHSGATSTSVNP